MTTTLPRTVFLARLLGLYFLAIAFSMIAQRPVIGQTMAELMHSPGLLFIAGATMVPAGLAIVIGHNVWSGGVLPVVVTIVGWLGALKGLSLLLLSPSAAVALYDRLHFDQYFFFYMTYVVLFGAYLTYAGFTHRRNRAA